MISTLGDLNRFDAALLSGRLLPRRILDEMLAPTPGSFPEEKGFFQYGLGIVITNLSCGVTAYGGAGDMPGSQSWVTGTRDGRQMLAVDLNADADWVNGHFGSLTMAAFCPASFPSQAPTS